MLSSSPAPTSAKTEMKPLRRISIITGGSRGDIQPYCAIALALERAGYSTRILTNEDHEPFVESFGLTHVHTFINNVEWLERDPAFRESISEGNAAALFAALSRANREESEPMCERFHEEIEAHRPDLLVAGVQGEFFEWYAKVALDVPVLRVELHALSREERGSFGLPTLPFGMHNVLFSLVVTKAIIKSWRSFDDALAKLTGGARVLSKLNLADLEEDFFAPKFPVIVCKSESYKSILNPNAHPNFKFVGAAIVQRKYEVKHSSSFGDDDVFNTLEEFLSRDEERKPVYMGWGSMVCKSPEHMVLLATEALRESGQRGIILGGWAQLSQELLENSTTDEALTEYARENILFVDKAPHEWLLHRVSAAVHHGGAGTTNASLRAGIPTIVTPVFIDQFDNAYLVGQLGAGVGFTKQFQRISAKELAAAVSQVTGTNGTYRAAAQSIALKLREENGAEAVVDEVERYWKEDVVTGEWQIALERLLAPSEAHWMKSTKKLLLLASIGVAGAFVLARCSSKRG